MAHHSIGDRVEVRWKAGLFAAKVAHVHPTGQVDAVYDIDGSVGICLTVEQHGLRLLKGGGTRPKKACVVDGCPRKAYCKGQLCMKHGGTPCSVDGCTSKAIARGLCKKHRVHLGECLREGCTTPAQKGGSLWCSTHTAKPPCTDPDCESPQILGKFVCVKHGANGNCTTDGCPSNAATRRGKCHKHDSKTVACSVEGCNTNGNARGLCRKHGTKKICSFNNCTTAVQPICRPVPQARRWQQESVRGERVHHHRSSSGCLHQAWRKRNVHVWRVHHQRIRWISALRKTRRRKEAVLRDGLHHHL